MEAIKQIIRTPGDLCIYCADIGELLDITKMKQDIMEFEVNLIGMVKTASCVIPMMVKSL